MAWSAEKLRWTLLGGVLLLAAVLAALFGLARYRAGKVWQHILARNGVNLVHETNGVTISQSVKGRTAFTLHAAKTVPHGNGSWSMQDAVLILYGKNNQADRIYGSKFEYDEKQGIVRAMGEVHMDLQAPMAATGKNQASPGRFSFTPGDQAAAAPGVIHVRTSELVYVRKLGTATTDQPTEFRYKGLTCTSRGAEFDSDHSMVHLPADVHLSGVLRDKPFVLAADRVDLDQDAKIVSLVAPVVSSNGQQARADRALLHLARDGSMQTGEASGGVQLRTGTRTLSAQQLDAKFGTENRPEHVQLRGGVALLDTNAARPAQGSAAALDLSMDAAGALHSAVADGGAAFTEKAITDGRVTATRQLRSKRAVANFLPVPGKASSAALHTLQMDGGGELSVDTPARGPGQPASAMRVNGDELTTTFVLNGSRNPAPGRMVGSGHTQLVQTRADGQQQTSTGDGLEVQFAGGKGDGARVEVASAVQAGHVALRSVAAPKPGGGQGADGSRPMIGRAEKAVYDGSVETLTLTGTGSALAEVEDGQMQLRAPAVVLHQTTGDGEASGGVTATTVGEAGSMATHVIAARATVTHGTEQSEFFGTAVQPAQMWQGGSQVQAAEILLDGRRHILSARPAGPGDGIHAVFAAQGRTDAGKPVQARPEASKKMPEGSRDAVRVSAHSMDYNDAQHEATFNGDVRMENAEGVITGERGAAFLQAAAAGGRSPATGSATVDVGGRLERLLVLGNVHLQQQGRTGVGEQLTYTAATDNFVLTGTAGKPPRIHDPQQGTLTGPTLVFGASDNSIVVAGTPAAGQTKPARVHTETDLKQQ